MTDVATRPAEAAPTSPTLARVMLVRSLQQLVKQDSRRPSELAEAMGVTTRTAERWVRGENQDIKAGQVIQLCAVLGFGPDHGTTKALVRLAQAAKQRGVTQRLDWFSTYQFDMFLGLEGGAAAIWTYESTMIPGLLQTSAYIEAFLRTTAPHLGDQDIAERVAVRVRRQEVLTRADRAAGLHALLDESAIRRAAASPVTMREQLAHLLTVSGRSNVTIQIVPFSVGPQLGGYPFVVMGFDGVAEFDGIGPVSYIETPTTAVYGETADQTDQVLAMHARLAAVALNPEDSAMMITAAMDAAGSER